MHSYGGLLEHRGSNVTPLKSTFNAEHFTHRLSWSTSNCFGAIQSRGPRLSYGVNPESISPGLDSVPGRDTPDRRTDRQTDRHNRHS